MARGYRYHFMKISLNSKTTAGLKTSQEKKGFRETRESDETDLRSLKFEIPVADQVHLRWMLSRDVGQVSAIERSCFEFSWTEEEFTRCLRQRNCVGMVAECHGEIVGFMIYELTRNRISLLNLGIHPRFRGHHVGRRLIEKLIGKLSGERRNRVICEVREKNLSAQLFFRSLGFRAVSILRNFYDQTREDAYVMQYRVSETRDEVRQETRRRAA